MKSNKIQVLFLSLACLGWTGWAVAQDFDKTQVQSVKVAEGVYLLQDVGGPIGGNIGVSTGADGVLLIDSQFGELHEKIKTALATIGGGAVRFVLDTNGHYDHALGNELLAKAGAVVIAHENARKRMMTEQIHDVIDEKTLPYPAAALPVVTFTKSLTLHLNGEDIQAMHVPNAHSDSDAFYWFRKANVIHTGDLFFSGGYPYIDIGNGGTINEHDRRCRQDPGNLRRENEVDPRPWILVGPEKTGGISGDAGRKQGPDGEDDQGRKAS